MGVDYVDIFYSHRPDPNTPMEETMMALDQIVRSGKALYAGISSYSADQTKEAAAILKRLGTPCLIHQPKYSMFVRWVEEKATANNESLMDVLEEEGMGAIAFSPLAQGLLTNKYVGGIPKDSRVGRGLSNGAISTADISAEVMDKIVALNNLAVQRNQSLAQMAIAWLMKDTRVTSVLVGASSSRQLDDNLACLKNLSFSLDELSSIEAILAG
jgi:L-glyceraldehyde 3-phosphate reductase